MLFFVSLGYLTHHKFFLGKLIRVVQCTSTTAVVGNIFINKKLNGTVQTYKQYCPVESNFVMKEFPFVSLA